MDGGVGLGAGGDDGVAEEEVAAEGVAAVGAVADGEGFVGADDAVGEGVLGVDAVADLRAGFVHRVVGGVTELGGGAVGEDGAPAGRWDWPRRSRAWC